MRVYCLYFNFTLMLVNNDKKKIFIILFVCSSLLLIIASLAFLKTEILLKENYSLKLKYFVVC